MEKQKYKVVDKNRELEYHFPDLIGKEVIITGEADEVTGKHPILVTNVNLKYLKYRNLKILKDYLVEV